MIEIIFQEKYISGFGDIASADCEVWSSDFADTIIAKAKELEIEGFPCRYLVDRHGQLVMCLSDKSEHLVPETFFPKMELVTLTCASKEKYENVIFPVHRGKIILEYGVLSPFAHHDRADTGTVVNNFLRTRAFVEKNR